MAASTSACRRASASRSSGSQTRQTRPISSASSAETHSEDSSIQAAFCRPDSSGNRYDDAASGATPSDVNGHLSRASVDMNARSAKPRMVQPMPRPSPLTAHDQRLRELDQRVDQPEEPVLARPRSRVGRDARASPAGRCRR